MRELVLSALKKMPVRSGDPEWETSLEAMPDNILVDLLIKRAHTDGYRQCMIDYPDNQYI